MMSGVLPFLAQVQSNGGTGGAIFAGGFFQSLLFTAYNTVAYADVPAELTSARPLRNNTGKTHGIRFKIMPPMKASPSALIKVIEPPGALGTGGFRGATSPGTTGAVTS